MDAFSKASRIFNRYAESTLKLRVILKKDAPVQFEVMDKKASQLQSLKKSFSDAGLSLDITVNGKQDVLLDKEFCSNNETNKVTINLLPVGPLGNKLKKHNAHTHWRLSGINVE